MKKLLLILAFISIGLSAISQSVITNAATDIAHTEATLNGVFNDLGIYTEFRDAEFEYSLNSDLSGSVTITANPTTSTAEGINATKNLTGLEPLTTYYYCFKTIVWRKVVFTQYTEVVIGDTIEFTTHGSPPTVYNYSDEGNTFEGWEPTTTSMTVYGDVSTIGSTPIVEIGNVWSTSGDPDINDNKFVHSTTSITGIYFYTLTGLDPGTNYYMNTFATNGNGTGYGQVYQIKTNTIIPTCTEATVRTESSFNANWDAVTGAQGYYLDVSTISDFSTTVPGYNNLNVFNVTTYNITGLSLETTYYYRVRAYHDGGADGTDFTSGSSSYKTTITLASEPNVQASEIMWQTVGDNLSLSWIDGNGVGNMLVMKASSNVTDPADGQEYNPSTIFGSGSEIGTGTYVIYRSEHFGGTNTVEISNIAVGVDYYFKVLEYTGLNTTTNYNTTNNTDGFGIGNTGSTILPVELIYFGAKKTGNSVTLNWVTASEINNDYFILEHSTDGKNFEEIGNVNGSGNSNITLDYSYEDSRELKGTNYYRLRQVDFDGKETVFNIVPVNCGNNNELVGNVYVDNTILNVELNSESFDATMIRLIDISGSDVQFVLSRTQGPRTIKLDMSDLSRGVYFVRIERGDEIINKKFVYQ